ncbi:amidophosphoribosyltransferase [bacterium]|nr:amidophosphoribosyltransferase [candidate division CSSED10-310 bacterium]
MLIHQGFHEECGVFGIVQHTEASNLVYLGIHALQHRGQESAGIVTSDGEELYSHRGMGLVADVFSQDILSGLKGTTGIGHVRYSTAGSSHLKNAQPVVVSCWRGQLALSHNGNLVNAHNLRDELELKGSIFQTTTDSEVILHLIAKSREHDLDQAVIQALKKVEGAYALLLLSKDKVIAVRDPNGFRPMVLGVKDGSVVMASETNALDLINAEFIREIDPGEMLIVNGSGMESIFPFTERRPSFCVFEQIYFARPDSMMFGKSVYEVRRNMGRQLARENPVDADIVIPVPDSGIVAALGASDEYGLPFEMGLIRNHYVGRTFIEPRQSIRDFGVKLKLNPVRPIIEGRRVVVVDDSIVRGTTSRKLVRLIRDAGAAEVHFRISSPPIIGPCRYGIDTPTREELIASTKNLEEIREYIGANSLGYLSIEGMMEAVCASGGHHCMACFNLDYPVNIFSDQPLSHN